MTYYVTGAVIATIMLIWSFTLKSDTKIQKNH